MNETVDDAVTLARAKAHQIKDGVREEEEELQ
jgi:hypothetical protein